MMDTNELTKLALDVDAMAGSDIAALRRALEEVIDHPRYAAWSLDADTRQGEQGGGRCPVPPDLKSRQFLERLALIDGECLRIKVHRHAGEVFCTDGLWVNQDIRVFPFSDESKRLIEHASAHGYDRWAETAVDPATGCGHHLIGLGGSCMKFGFDVNPRAILYGSINARVNAKPQVLLSRNNIGAGMPPHLDGLGGKVLFLVNMPFAISPIERVLPLCSDGGLTGARWTFAALQAIHGFAQRNRGAESVRACVLCYSVGNSQEGRWEIAERAEELFPGRVRWNLLVNERMWRVNGRKEQPNPMSLAAGLKLKAECRFYVRDEQRDAVRRGYEELARALAAPAQDGGGRWDVLGYGIVDVEVR